VVVGVRGVGERAVGVEFDIAVRGGVSSTAVTASPSGSRSLVSTLPVTAVSSLVVYASSTPTGARLTGVMTMSTRPVLLSSPLNAV